MPGQPIQVPQVALERRPERLAAQLVPLQEALQAAEAELQELLGTQWDLMDLKDPGN